ncbi:hypothetical protein [uncultured Veillonella sp.]|jgi:hypothetical protein|uniref:hypothetical protein n=1 Tax=uncultured Veillonella sp. TaxID=159268 RepID=UPI002596D7C7|nr:hypothetical protein [uncultured Veillonella sp.]
MNKIAKAGLYTFLTVNATYTVYKLYKNFKDYKNKEGIYAPEEVVEAVTDEATGQIETVEEAVEPEVKKIDKKKVKTYIGIGLLAAAVIGGYCYGYRTAWVKRSAYAHEAEELLFANNDLLKEHIELLEEEGLQREIQLGVERETIVSNAINMLLPDKLETRWVSFSKDGDVHSNFTPNHDFDGEEVTKEVNDIWEKLYEKVVVAPLDPEADKVVAA